LQGGLDLRALLQHGRSERLLHIEAALHHLHVPVVALTSDMDGVAFDDNGLFVERDDFDIDRLKVWRVL
jgi:hypothetical protein